MPSLVASNLVAQAIINQTELLQKQLVSAERWANGCRAVGCWSYAHFWQQRVDYCKAKLGIKSG